MTRYGQTIAAAVLIAAAAFAAYSGALKAGFVYDDEHLISRNALIKNLSSAPSYFRTDLFSDIPGARTSNSYRPIHTLFNAVDYALYGLEPYGYHLTNILLHVLNAALIFVFLRGISGSPFIALSVSLIFSVHPVNTQSVAYIAGRGDLLMSVFAMTSLIFFSKYIKGDKLALFLSAASYALSILSREAGAVIALLMIAGYAAYFRNGRPVKLRPLSIYPIVGFACLALRSFALKGPAAAIGLEYVPLMQRIATSIKSLFISLRIIIFPYDLHFDRSVAVGKSVFTLPVLASLLGVAVIVWAAARLYREGERPGSGAAKSASFGIYWYLVSMAPYLNIVPLQVFVSENWLYYPSAGVILVFVALASSYVRPGSGVKSRILKTAAFVLLAGILAAYGLTTAKRVADYSDPAKLYLKNLEYEPNVKFYYMLGTEYGLKKEYEKAIEAFKKAIETDRSRPNLFVLNARFNLAVTYAVTGRTPEAMKEFAYLTDLKAMPQSVREKWRDKASRAMRELGGRWR